MNELITTDEATAVESPRDETGELADEAGRPLIVTSGELLQGRRELWIEHRGEMYRLRLTSAGKLYMTK